MHPAPDASPVPIHALILAGGSGTRLWPAARASRPKQVLPLSPGGVPMLQATVDRLASACETDAVWVITNPHQRDVVAGCVSSTPRGRGVTQRRVLVEPEARNTAPCILLGAARIEAAAPGAVQVVLPADHVIDTTPDDFARLVERAARATLRDDALVTFGITPTRPATGYGYIETGDAVDDGDPPLHAVRSFREKPDEDTARRFVADGRHVWNSGMFCWTWRALRNALDGRRDEAGRTMAAAADALLAAVRSGDEDAVASAFARLPATSIDYAVLEHAPAILVVGCSMPWHDVGSFANLDAVGTCDADGNATLAVDGAEVLSLDSRNCATYAAGDRVVVTLGCDDLVVVAVDDAVLVCPRGQAERVREAVAALRERNRTARL